MDISSSDDKFIHFFSVYPQVGSEFIRNFSDQLKKTFFFEILQYGTIIQTSQCSLVFFVDKINVGINLHMENTADHNKELIWIQLTLEDLHIWRSRENRW